MPSNLYDYSFLVDVHMDSGRVSKPFVSSLGAFWPSIQALACESVPATGPAFLPPRDVHSL